MSTTIFPKCAAKQTGAATPNGFTLARTCAGAAEFLQELNQNLARSLASQFTQIPGVRIAQALTEAEALAYQTPFPHFLLPELAEEKVREAARWATRQTNLRAPRELPTAALSV